MYLQEQLIMHVVGSGKIESVLPADPMQKVRGTEQFAWVSEISHGWQSNVALHIVKGIQDSHADGEGGDGLVVQGAVVQAG